ncbi:MAG: PilZ domain-containing protein [Pseudomonadota bacterium]
MNRRMLKRRPLVFYFKVFEQDSGELLGYIGDITAEGMMLISQNPIPKNRVLQLRIYLPVEIFIKESADIKAQSIWCKQGLKPELYEIGFKLLDTVTSDLEALIALIARYSINAPPSRQ